MGFAEYIKANEKVYEAGAEIKYLFCEKKGSDKLIVTFPGFTNSGKFKYRYVRTLKNINAHRLFLLDEFGTRGCYLVGHNRDFKIETVVISLIHSILKKYNLTIDDVILQGSSKGGWMALYYGIKYRFGYVIAGGPQTKMGDFLIKEDIQPMPDDQIHSFSKIRVADYIAGGHGEEDLKYLNNLLYEQLNINPEDFPKIHIHVGNGDSHFENHIKPFTHYLDQKNIKYELDVEEYHDHNDLGVYYPKFLHKTLRTIDEKIINPKKTSLLYKLK